MKLRIPRNPVFQRELLTLLRHPRSFALLALALVLSSAVMLSAWPDEPQGIVHQGERARALFAIFGQAQLLVLALVIPGALGGAVSVEKEGETLDLLLTTPISGDAIALGKLGSGLGFLALVGLASLPILMLCFLIGGLSGSDVLGLFGLLAAQGVLFGLTSLCCSALISRTPMAVMLSYLLVAIEAAVFLSIYGDGLRLFSRGGGWRLLGLAGFVSLLVYLVVRWAVRRPHHPRVKPLAEENPRTTQGLVLQHGQFPDLLLLPARRRDVLPDGTNPMARKELQAGIYGSGSLFVRVIIQLGLFLGLAVMIYSMVRSLHHSSRMVPTQVAFPFHCFAVAFAATLGAALGARGFSGEREQGTAELLVGVILPRRSLVLGKLWAALRMVVVLTCLNCFLVLLLPVVAPEGFLWQLGALLLLIGVTSTWSIALGLRCSLRASSTVAAMVRTYGIVFALWLLPLLLLQAAGLVQQGASWLEFLVRLLSPFAAAQLPVDRGGAPSVPHAVCFLGYLAQSLVVAGFLLRSCVRGCDDALRSGATRS